MVDLPNVQFDPDALIDQGQAARQSVANRRQQTAFLVSGSVTVIWVITVTALGLWGRVSDHGIAATTMVFGSFVAGATPQGGGAVAFPVFTKALAIPSETARSFSLSIQAIGMTAASISILIRRSPVVWRAVAAGAACGIAGFVGTLLLLADFSQPFAPVNLPGEFVKVTFTLIVLAMTAATIVAFRTPIRSVSGDIPTNDRILVAMMLGFATLGGVASALLGSGADVMIYLFLVVILGIRSTVGVPTSVLTMTAVSIVGFFVMAILDGQFQIGFTVDGEVATVGGEALPEPQTPRRADLFGMWLAAAPIVAWGAPMGALVASKLKARTLTMAVVALGSIEVITTVLFLSELRTSVGLLVYAIAGALLGVFGVIGLARFFRLRAARASRSTTLTRDSVEVSASYSENINE